mmetsp:Transcript_35365/g.75535  ORF Transcript_35365/g.75535 Transcript_35365/m.75535 type:complete len:135 (-) Transcript_35365:130-534(-)
MVVTCDHSSMIQATAILIVRADGHLVHSIGSLVYATCTPHCIELPKPFWDITDTRDSEDAAPSPILGHIRRNGRGNKKRSAKTDVTTRGADKKSEVSGHELPATFPDAQIRPVQLELHHRALARAQEAATEAAQ